jgi:type I restriction enzyme S subunit
MVTLGEIVTIERNSVSPDEIAPGSKYVGLEHIESGGGSLSYGSVSNGDLASSKFRFGLHHVLFGKLRPYLAKIVCPNFEGICSTDILPIAPRKHVDKRYLLHFLRFPQTVDWVASRATGINLPRISPDSLASLEVPLPPLDEQRRIAAILDKADALRRKRKRALDLLNQLTRSIFYRTFVEQSSRSWPKRSIASLARNIRTGPFGSQLLHSEFTDEGVAVLGIDNAVMNEFRWGERRYITRDKYAKLRRYTVLPGDVLITIMGTCGRCAVVPDDVPVAINTKHLCCITLDQTNCLPEFLHATFLEHPDIRQQLGVQAKGAVMPGLNMGIIKSLTIPLPSIDLQQAFVKKIHELKRTLHASRASEFAIKELFESLQQRAFSGQLRN